MKPSEIIQRIRVLLDMGDRESLNRAGSFLLVWTEMGVPEERAKEFDLLGKRWHRAYGSLPPSDQRHPDLRNLRSFLEMMYEVPKEGDFERELMLVVERSDPPIPSRRPGLPPISEAEAKWISRALDGEDHLREVFAAAPNIKGDGIVLVRPLIELGGIAIYGHSIAPLYRRGAIRRLDPSETRAADFQLLSDLLVLRALTDGSLSASSRDDAVMRLTPYLRMLPEDQLVRAGKAEVRRLRANGVFENGDRGKWRCSAAAAADARRLLLPQWVEAVIAPPEVDEAD